MRDFLPFDPAHPRCVHPEYGANFDKVMLASGLTAVQIAKAAKISPEVVRGYRRGFYRPTTVTEAKLEAVFGTSLKMPETTTPTSSKPLPMLPLKVPDYFEPEDAVMTDNGDMLVTFRIPRQQVLDMVTDKVSAA